MDPYYSLYGFRHILGSNGMDSANLIEPTQFLMRECNIPRLPRVAQGYGLHSPGHSEQQFSVQRQHRPLHGGGGTVQDVVQQGYAEDGRRPLSGEAARMSDPESTVYLDHAPQVRQMSPLNDTGGYDFNFVEPLDEALRCPICLLALRVPVQTTCGHR